MDTMFADHVVPGTWFGKKNITFGPSHERRVILEDFLGTWVFTCLYPTHIRMMAHPNQWIGLHSSVCADQSNLHCFVFLISKRRNSNPCPFFNHMVVMAGLWPSFADDILISVLHPHPEVLTSLSLSAAASCVKPITSQICCSWAFTKFSAFTTLVELFAWYVPSGATLAVPLVSSKEVIQGQARSVAWEDSHGSIWQHHGSRQQKNNMVIIHGYPVMSGSKHPIYKHHWTASLVIICDHDD